MRYMPLVALMSVGWAAAALGQEQATRDAVAKAINEAAEAIQANYERFQESNESPLDRARRTLADKVNALNVANNVNEASYVQEAIAGLEKTVMSRAVPGWTATKPKPQPTPTPQPQPKPLIERMAGEWIQPNRGEKRLITPEGKFSQIRITAGASTAATAAAAVSGNARATWLLTDGTHVNAWLIDDDLMAFVFIPQSGAQIGDGEVWQRSGCCPEPNCEKAASGGVVPMSRRSKGAAEQFAGTACWQVGKSQHGPPQ